ncbi:hypothetical protein [Paenibacillus contaminans]|uniref:Uncharacterized protein n=1 Tax=Paenibacillus contaminans TaxID=450362 RepID=A0A329MR15_9BACL|nr:hypothetical protein [Paenibacillus contaminans]RAV22234.1 hypothetical protein DQG23_04585 [Paenibacillus contaminans]
MKNRKNYANELREIAGGHEGLRSAIEAYEREPELLQEIDQLRASISAVVKAVAGGAGEHGTT